MKRSFRNSESLLFAGVFPTPGNHFHLPCTFWLVVGAVVLVAHEKKCFKFCSRFEMNDLISSRSLRIFCL